MYCNIYNIHIVKTVSYIFFPKFVMHINAYVNRSIHTDCSAPIVFFLLNNIPWKVFYFNMLRFTILLLRARCILLDDFIILGSVSPYCWLSCFKVFALEAALQWIPVYTRMTSHSLCISNGIVTALPWRNLRVQG